MPVVHEAEARLWADIDPGVRAALAYGAHADLRHALLTGLSDLAAPAIFGRLVEARQQDVGYDEFVSDMRTSGFRRLFDDKPVLLRLMACLTRQWIDTSAELVTRLAADMASLRRELLNSDTACSVARIEGQLSDPHNFGRSVRILEFEDGSRVVYKPKDLSVDAAWARLIDKLNEVAPVELRGMRVLDRAAYGWTEFIAHTKCDDAQDFKAFYRRGGAWLALIHVFVGVDMHHENFIATGSHPVPVDLEMILQRDDLRIEREDETGQAFVTAMRKIIDSVVTIGLLPAYGSQSTNEVFVIGGMNSNASPRKTVRWTGVNTDAMAPVKERDTAVTVTNLPYIDGRRASLADHLDDFMLGFIDYARFLQGRQDLMDGFAGLTVRTVLRPTRFYAGLLARLRDHRSMDDGVVWSAQADFAARLADWERDSDPNWTRLQSERIALVNLNVPHFTTVADLTRADARLRGLSDAEIDWQNELIRQNTDLLRPRSTDRSLRAITSDTEYVDSVFIDGANELAAALSTHAIRNGPGAAWIGLDFLGDSEVSQLVVLGSDLYNGHVGVALFFAAHAATTGDSASKTLAYAAVASLRRNLRGRNPARLARSIGIGAGLGLGSVVYGLSVMAELLDDDAILADAHAAAELITDDVIAADSRLDVLGGSAGAVLGLLRLYRQTGSERALMLAEKCGAGLLSHKRVGPHGARSWAAPVFDRPLNGMSHGAAGFAYSLHALAFASGYEEFAGAATECVTFENSTFDADRHGWADLREMADASWPCKWCYGAPGIGLARIGMTKLAGVPSESCAPDIGRALTGVERGWPAETDTLCCGTLGSIEFLREAGDAMDRPDLRDEGTRLLRTIVETAHQAGDFRWSSGTGRFNLGLFRGIAGVGYTLLREVDRSLPNVLVWE
jgi:lantibiotic modifying enzyme